MRSVPLSCAAREYIPLIPSRIRSPASSETPSPAKPEARAFFTSKPQPSSVTKTTMCFSADSDSEEFFSGFGFRGKPDNHGCFLCLGMAGGIGEAFLYKPEHIQLGLV